MLTVDVERACDVAIVRCAGRIVRGAEVSSYAMQWSRRRTRAPSCSTCQSWSLSTPAGSAHWCFLAQLDSGSRHTS